VARQGSALAARVVRRGVTPAAQAAQAQAAVVPLAMDRMQAAVQAAVAFSKSNFSERTNND